MSSVPFAEHVELLQAVLACRDEIVEQLQGLLNAQRKPEGSVQDGLQLSRQFEDCIFAPAAVGPARSHLRGQLQQAHWASGFRPRAMPGLHNDLVDPGQMVIRAFHLWRRTRWPGRNGRIRYAQTLFNLYVIRTMEFLVMRVWDAGPADAPGRLLEAQAVLDRLWETSPADQPVVIRDARWLIPLAQSPTTDELSPYFAVLKSITGSLPESDRIETHSASVRMAGGHLRSQLRHHLTSKHTSLDDPALVLSSRNSNALDFAMLVQGLVPLLDRYERACDGDDPEHRVQLAGAICQGLSVDPELFVNRIDLLRPYTMIEHLFVAIDEAGHPGYTAAGKRHTQLLLDYVGQIERLSKRLHEDCSKFTPVAGSYSPYGLIYGFSSNLTEHIAFKTLTTGPMTRFSLEDAFIEGDGQKLAWVNGWRKLPHIDAAVQRLFDYPQRFADEIAVRLDQALAKRTVGNSTAAVGRTGRLYLSETADPALADLPSRYVRSSDAHWVAAGKAQSCDQTQLLRDRQEGTFVVSFETSNGWVGITKDILTDILGIGLDARISGLPGQVAGLLRLMCPGLVVVTY